MSKLIRFNIPEVSNEFREYLLNRLKTELSIDIFKDLLSQILNVDVGLETDERIKKEVRKFLSLEFGTCEIGIIFWQGILNAGLIRMDEMFQVDHVG